MLNTSGVYNNHMDTTEDYIRYLEGGTAVLEDYLLSSEMFWAIGVPAAEAGTELPRLTMGGLMLAWALARAGPKSAEQRRRFESVEARIEAVRKRWRVAWGRKCEHSFHTRLMMWRNFLEEYRSEPKQNAERYPHEVRMRLMLHLLQKDAQPIGEAELRLLSTLDSLLRHVLRPGGFVWDAERAGGFPPEEYWFLYGYLPRNLS